MKRVAVLLALAACPKKHDQPKLYLDSGHVAVTADAAPVPDAPPPPAEKPVPTELVVGDTIACALLSDATVRCWNGAEPAVDEHIHGVKQLVASKGFACALLDDASVSCWGDIGFGTAAKTPKPVGVPSVTKVQKIFAVGGAACATIANTGALACWGDVDERGRITETGAHRAATAVAGLDHVTQLSARAALRDDGSLVYYDAGTPKPVAIHDGKQLASLGDTTCVLSATGFVSCTPPDPPCTAPPPPPKKPGKGKRPAKPAPPPPEPKPALEELALGKSAQLAFGMGGLCALGNGQVTCIDPAQRCHDKPEHRSGPQLDQVSGPCAITSRQRGVVCWDKGKPAAIAGIEHAAAIVANAAQACAADKEHHVACWTGSGPARPIAIP